MGPEIRACGRARALIVATRLGAVDHIKYYYIRPIESSTEPKLTTIVTQPPLLLVYYVVLQYSY